MNYKLVPIEPTQAMVDAWCDAAPHESDRCTNDELNRRAAAADWQAMLNAAPTPNDVSEWLSDLTDLLMQLANQPGEIGQRAEGLGQSLPSLRAALGVQPPAAPEPHRCGTCAHNGIDADAWPCGNCINYERWTPTAGVPDAGKTVDEKG